MELVGWSRPFSASFPGCCSSKWFKTSVAAQGIPTSTRAKTWRSEKRNTLTTIERGRAFPGMIVIGDSVQDKDTMVLSLVSEGEIV